MNRRTVSVDISDTMLNRSQMVLTLMGLVALAIAILAGCNSFPSKTDPKSQDSYHAVGMLIKNMDTDSTSIVIDFQRNNNVEASGSIRFDNSALLFSGNGAEIDSVYALTTTSAATYSSGSFKLHFGDNNSLNDSVTVSLADTFTAQLATEVKLVQGLKSVPISWTASASADAYVLAAIKTDSVFIGHGWSVFSSGQTTSDFILSDAWLSDDGLNPDTGLYYVYVYAVTGAPDSLQSTKLLPVPLPQQLPDNISRVNSRLTGRFGSVVVARHDTVRVTFQP
ncbi:MAG: hypothetical protein ACE5FH_11645 [Candidatus Zixiibacteriota bacterium]